MATVTGLEPFLVPSQPGIAMENALLIVAQFPDEFIARCRGLAWRYDEGS